MNKDITEEVDPIGDPSCPWYLLFAKEICNDIIEMTGGKNRSNDAESPEIEENQNEQGRLDGTVMTSWKSWVPSKRWQQWWWWWWNKGFTIDSVVFVRRSINIYKVNKTPRTNCTR